MYILCVYICFVLTCSFMLELTTGKVPPRTLCVLDALFAHDGYYAFYNFWLLQGYTQCRRTQERYNLAGDLICVTGVHVYV